MKETTTVMSANTISEPGRRSYTALALTLNEPFRKRLMLFSRRGWHIIGAHREWSVISGCNQTKVASVAGAEFMVLDFTLKPTIKNG